MSPDLVTSPGPVRPAEAVNEDIRTLMRRAGGHLKPQDRPTYQQLVDEWNIATARERKLRNVGAAA